MKYSTPCHSSFSVQSGLKAVIVAQSLVPLLCLRYACSNWFLKPSTTSGYLSSHYSGPTLHDVQKLVPRGNSFTHDVGIGDDGSGLVSRFIRQEERGDLGEPDSRGSGN